MNKLLHDQQNCLEKKQKLIEEFEIAMKEQAIDCKLFYNRNNYKGDKQLKCSK